MRFNTAVFFGSDFSVHLLFFPLFTDPFSGKHIFFCPCFYLQPNLLVHSDGPVAEGDGVAEAGLSLDGPLGHVHDDLRALGAGVEEQGEGGQIPTWLDGQTALWFVVASVGCGGKRPVQGI